MAVANFDSTKQSLQDILRNVDAGKVQLPDFQRGWVWDDEHIKSLIASLSLSFPIGAVMTLDTGGADVTFKPRPIEGTDDRLQLVEPETLILDGQQRLTSLFQSLMSGKAVETKDAKGKKTKRWYYLDMKKCVADVTDREDAVVSVLEERLVTRNFGREIELDLSSSEQEYENEMFPVQLIFESAEWRQGYSEHWDFDRDKMRLFNAFEREVIKPFEQYNIPMIRLSKETPKEAVCLVFEKVNQGGVTLTVFELLTASLAAHNFQLREDWDSREKRLKTGYTVLENLQNDAFLQALTLLVTKASDRAIGCRRRDILRLSVDDYVKWADKVEKAFIEAARFMHSQKVFKARDLPYQTQLVPLAAILADLGDAGGTEGAHQKLARWYWCGVFGEVYSGPTETLFARDLPEVAGWVRGESADEPTTIRDANFQASRLLTLRTRNSAAYKGVHALLMRDGSRDFRTGEPVEAQIFFDDNIDIHHVFPQSWCRRQRIESRVFDSIVNKTAIAARTNRKIGGRAPSTYLRGLQRDADIDAEQLDEMLASHRVPAAELRADNFQKFFAARGEELCRAIEAAMGKTVVREEGVFSLDTPVEDYDDGPTDWEEEATLGAPAQVEQGGSGMPQSDQAAEALVSSTEEHATGRAEGIDLTPYREFIQTCELNTPIDLPLDSGDSPQAVRRRLTYASRELGLHLRHLQNEEPAVVRFKLTEPAAAEEGGTPYCLCGCGAANRPGSKFLMGHDARLRSVLMRMERGDPTAGLQPQTIEMFRQNPELTVAEFTADDVLRLAGRRS